MLVSCLRVRMFESRGAPSSDASDEATSAPVCSDSISRVSTWISTPRGLETEDQEGAVVIVEKEENLGQPKISHMLPVSHWPSMLGPRD